MKKKFVNSINHFRAIAIILIVSAHNFELVGLNQSSNFNKILYCLIPGGTAFFVFISGFLFHHVFYEQFNFKNFLINKTKFVLIPYLFLTTILSVYIALDTTLDIKSSLINYITGGIVSAYWYIPFIMVIFLLSPLFIVFIKTNNTKKITVIALFLIISLFIHRKMDSVISVLQNVIYYTPIYLMGIYFSIEKNLIYSKLKNKEILFLLTGIFIAFLQVKFNCVGNSFKDFYVYRGIDLMLIQKIFLIIFFFVFLNRFENKQVNYLDSIAANSFGIFFIHCIYIQLLLKIKIHFNIQFYGNPYLIYVLTLIIVFFLAYFSSLIMVRLFGKKSKYLIGN